MALLGSVTSSKIAAHMIAVLDFTKNSNLSGKCGNCTYFFSRVVNYEPIKHFAAFGGFYKFYTEKMVKNTHFFI